MDKFHLLVDGFSPSISATYFGRWVKSIYWQMDFFHQILQQRLVIWTIGSILLHRFFASSLLGLYWFAVKKYQSTSLLLRFLVKLQQKFELFFIASSLLRIFKQKNLAFASSLLSFFASKSISLFRFFASKNLPSEKSGLCFIASSLLRFYNILPGLSYGQSGPFCFIASSLLCF